MAKKEEEKKELTPTAALKEYMQSGEKWGRKCDLKELKSISAEERNELGALALIAIKEGWE